MSTLLVILLYAADVDGAATRVVREFPTRALCELERAHLEQQAVPAGLGGRMLLWCQERT